MTNNGSRDRRRLFVPLVIELRNLSADEALEMLWREGLLDVRNIEYRAIRRAVARHVRSGEHKCRAMENVANEFDCSYDKVKMVVYGSNGSLRV